MAAVPAKSRLQTIGWNLAVAAIVTALSGCGSGAMVEGKATLDGQPLGSGTVTFHPVNGGPLVTAAIQHDGSYQVSYDSHPGLVRGQYVVAVVGHQPIPRPTPEQPMPRFQPVLPERYSIAAHSDLRVILKSGRNVFDLPLRSQDRGK